MTSYDIVVLSLFQKNESIENEAYNKGIENGRSEGRAMLKGHEENETRKSVDAAAEVRLAFKGHQ